MLQAAELDMSLHTAFDEGSFSIDAGAKTVEGRAATSCHPRLSVRDIRNGRLVAHCQTGSAMPRRAPVCVHISRVQTGGGPCPMTNRLGA